MQDNYKLFPQLSSSFKNDYVIGNILQSASGPKNIERPKVLSKSMNRLPKHVEPVREYATDILADKVGNRSRLRKSKFMYSEVLQTNHRKGQQSKFVKDCIDIQRLQTVSRQSTSRNNHGRITKASTKVFLPQPLSPPIKYKLVKNNHESLFKKKQSEN